MAKYTVKGDLEMDRDLELLESEHAYDIKKLLNEYKLKIGDQKVGIKTYLDSNGYYQMETSHLYRGEGKAGVYTASAANFQSEYEALTFAKRQLLSFYDGQGEWFKNEMY